MDIDSDTEEDFIPENLRNLKNKAFFSSQTQSEFSQSQRGKQGCSTQQYSQKRGPLSVQPAIKKNRHDQGSIQPLSPLGSSQYHHAGRTFKAHSQSGSFNQFWRNKTQKNDPFGSPLQPTGSECDSLSPDEPVMLSLCPKKAKQDSSAGKPPASNRNISCDLLTKFDASGVETVDETDYSFDEETDKVTGCTPQIKTLPTLDKIQKCSGRPVFGKAVPKTSAVKVTNIVTPSSKPLNVTTNRTKQKHTSEKLLRHVRPSSSHSDMQRVTLKSEEKSEKEKERKSFSIGNSSTQCAEGESQDEDLILPELAFASKRRQRVGTKATSSSSLVATSKERKDDNHTTPKTGQEKFHRSESNSARLVELSLSHESGSSDADIESVSSDDDFEHDLKVSALEQSDSTPQNAGLSMAKAHPSVLKHQPSLLLSAERNSGAAFLQTHVAQNIDNTITVSEESTQEYSDLSPDIFEKDVTKEPTQKYSDLSPDILQKDVTETPTQKYSDLSPDIFQKDVTEESTQEYLVHSPVILQQDDQYIQTNNRTKISDTDGLGFVQISDIKSIAANQVQNLDIAVNQTDKTDADVGPVCNLSPVRMNEPSTVDFGLSSRPASAESDLTQPYEPSDHESLDAPPTLESIKSIPSMLQNQISGHSLSPPQLTRKLSSVVSDSASTIFSDNAWPALSASALKNMKVEQNAWGESITTSSMVLGSSEAEDSPVYQIKQERSPPRERQRNISGECLSVRVPLPDCPTLQDSNREGNPTTESLTISVSLPKNQQDQVIPSLRLMRETGEGSNSNAQFHTGLCLPIKEEKEDFTFSTTASAKILEHTEDDTDSDNSQCLFEDLPLLVKQELEVYMSDAEEEQNHVNNGSLTSPRHSHLSDVQVIPKMEVESTDETAESDCKSYGAISSLTSPAKRDMAAENTGYTVEDDFVLIFDSDEEEMFTSFTQVEVKNEVNSENEEENLWSQDLNDKHLLEAVSVTGSDDMELAKEEQDRIDKETSEVMSDADSDDEISLDLSDDEDMGGLEYEADDLNRVTFSDPAHEENVVSTHSLDLHQDQEPDFKQNAKLLSVFSQPTLQDNNSDEFSDADDVYFMDTQIDEDLCESADKGVKSTFEKSVSCVTDGKDSIVDGFDDDMDETLLAAATEVEQDSALNKGSMPIRTEVSISKNKDLTTECFLSLSRPTIKETGQYSTEFKTDQSAENSTHSIDTVKPAERGSLWKNSDTDTVRGRWTSNSITSLRPQSESKPSDLVPDNIVDLTLNSSDEECQIDNRISDLNTLHEDGTQRKEESFQYVNADNRSDCIHVARGRQQRLSSEKQRLYEAQTLVDVEALSDDQVEEEDIYSVLTQRDFDPYLVATQVDPQSSGSDSEIDVTDQSKEKMEEKELSESDSETKSNTEEAASLKPKSGGDEEYHKKLSSKSDSKSELDISVGLEEQYEDLYSEREERENLVLQSSEQAENITSDQSILEKVSLSTPPIQNLSSKLLIEKAQKKMSEINQKNYLSRAVEIEPLPQSRRRGKPVGLKQKLCHEEAPVKEPQKEKPHCSWNDPDADYLKSGIVCRSASSDEPSSKIRMLESGSSWLSKKPVPITSKPKVPTKASSKPQQSHKRPKPPSIPSVSTEAKKGREQMEARRRKANMHPEVTGVRIRRHRETVQLTNPDFNTDVELPSTQERIELGLPLLDAPRLVPKVHLTERKKNAEPCSSISESRHQASSYLSSPPQSETEWSTFSFQQSVHAEPEEKEGRKHGEKDRMMASAGEHVKAQVSLKHKITSCNSEHTNEEGSSRKRFRLHAPAEKVQSFQKEDYYSEKDNRPQFFSVDAIASISTTDNVTTTTNEPPHTLSTPGSAMRNIFDDFCAESFGPAERVHGYLLPKHKEGQQSGVSVPEVRHSSFGNKFTYDDGAGGDDEECISHRKRRHSSSSVSSDKKQADSAESDSGERKGTRISRLGDLTLSATSRRSSEKEAQCDRRTSESGHADVSVEAHPKPSKINEHDSELKDSKRKRQDRQPKESEFRKDDSELKESDCRKGVGKVSEQRKENKKHKDREHSNEDRKHRDTEPSKNRKQKETESKNEERKCKDTVHRKEDKQHKDRKHTDRKEDKKQKHCGHEKDGKQKESEDRKYRDKEYTKEDKTQTDSRHMKEHRKHKESELTEEDRKQKDSELRKEDREQKDSEYRKHGESKQRKDGGEHKSKHVRDRRHRENEHSKHKDSIERGEGKESEYKKNLHMDNKEPSASSTDKQDVSETVNGEEENKDMGHPKVKSSTAKDKDKSVSLEGQPNRSVESEMSGETITKFTKPLFHESTGCQKTATTDSSAKTARIRPPTPPKIRPPTPPTSSASTGLSEDNVGEAPENSSLTSHQADDHVGISADSGSSSARGVGLKKKTVRFNPNIQYKCLTPVKNASAVPHCPPIPSVQELPTFQELLNPGLTPVQQKAYPFVGNPMQKRLPPLQEQQQQQQLQRARLQQAGIQEFVFKPLIVDGNKGGNTTTSGTVQNLLGPDDLTHMLLRWSPHWLAEYEAKLTKATDNYPNTDILPPVVDLKDLYPLLTTYGDKIVEYQQICFKLLLLETWEDVFRGWKEKQKQHKVAPWHVFHSETTRRGQQSFISLGWTGLLTEQEYQSRHYPIESDLVVVNMVGFSLPDNTHKSYQGSLSTEVKTAQLAYVEDVTIFKCQDLEQLLRKHPQLKKHPAALASSKTVYVLKVTLKTRYRKFAPSNKCLITVNAVASLTPAQRRFAALQMLPRCPLMRDILNPSASAAGQGVAVPSSLMGRTQLNEVQSLVVRTGLSAVLHQPPSIPRICLLQGPPGTGKSHVVVALIFRILQGNPQAKICLAAPSNAAADELLKRLYKKKRDFNLKFDMVRIGNIDSTHGQVKQFALEARIQNAKEKALHHKRLQMVPQTVRTEHERLEKKLKQMMDQIRTLRNSKNNTAQQVATLEKEMKKEQRKMDVLTRQMNQGIQNADLTGPEIAQIYSEQLKTPQIVCGTLSSFGQPRIISTLCRNPTDKRRNNNHFTCAIIDEATQATELDSLIPLQYGMTKLFLVGDPKQLPPTVLSTRAQSLSYNLSLFERLYNHFHDQSKDSNPVMMLQTQYRMDPAICHFPNHHVYEGQLTTDEKVEANCEKFPLHPYIVFDVESQELLSQSGTLSNEMEADCTAVLCQQLIDPSLRIEAHSIGIICPYAGQKRLVISKLKERGMENIEVNTVDGFQGREKHIIILSCVRARSSTGGIGFMADTRRMNVALTRAKYALYIIGHVQSLMTDSDWRSLIQDATTRRGGSVVHKVPSLEEFPSIVRRICFKPKFMPRGPRQDIRGKHK